MRDLPSGTVTFLFTDVEGSTRLLHELGDGYAEVLAEHRRVLRDAFTRHGGVEVDTLGDAFFVAFTRASAAVAAAVEARDALADGPVRVRVGIHTGEPRLTDEGYIGIDVHRAARIASAGHGGQILVSQAASDLVGVGELRDLGEHLLKDLAAPERIYQVGEADFPPLKTLNNSNLPVPAEPLVGRKKELVDVLRLLRDSARLVTVIGPGGAGKTRFALEVGSELVESFRDGVWWVGLAPIRDAGLVLSTIGSAVGAKDDPAGELRGKNALLVLDNFEHVVGAAPDVAELHRSCPDVSLLVTSREPLHIAGEREVPLGPLAESPAVELFRQRAEAVAPGFDADNGTLVEVCDRLDRLPLAIELAAARVKTLAADALLQRLDQRLPLLSSRRRDVDERQRTLRATIEWSYELLEPADKRAFGALSVFVGSFDAAAAEDVAAIDLDTLDSLVDKSLIHMRDDGRFFMFETIREYAAAVLAAADSGDELRERHLDYFLRLLVVTEVEFGTERADEALVKLALEENNIRAAFAYACESGDAERALMLAGSNGRFWSRRAQIREAIAAYERAFALGGEASARARGRALYGFGEMKRVTGEFDEARDLLERSIPLLQRAGEEPRWVMSAKNHLANAMLDAGELEGARAVYEETLELTRRAGSLRGMGVVTGNLGFLALHQGRHDEAEKWLREAYDFDLRSGNVDGRATTLGNLTLLALQRGDHSAAAASLRECIELLRSQHAEWGAFEALILAAAVLGDRDAATGVQLHSAGRAHAAGRGYEISGLELQVAEQALVHARSALGEDAFAAEWSAGQQLDLDTALALALQSLD